ncbi:MAG: heparinase II/III domain-containing protein [Verrucomicrobiia bacterium]
METTRRGLFKLLGGGSMLASMAGAANLRTGPGPRLFFGAEELPRLRKLFAEDERFAPLRHELIGRDREAERAFLRGDINFNDQLKNLMRVGSSAEEMAWVYLMTGDSDAADLAIECARTMMKFPLWDFFADEHRRAVGVQRAPSSAISMACAIDWLGDKVADDERAAWLVAIAERGCEPCYRGLDSIRNPRKNLGWDFNPDSDIYAERKFFPTDLARRAEITQDTNLRAAPAGGLAVGAAVIALYGGPKADLERWLELAVHSLKAFERIYLPDGSYGEGIHYANYTSESVLVGVEALRKSGLMPIDVNVDWVGHMQFMLNMSMATAENPYEVVNIGDNGQRRDPEKFQHPNGKPETRTAVPYWVAREFRDGSAQWFAKNLGASHDIWALIFCDDSVSEIEPKSGAQTWFPEVDWVVARTGFAADDLVVSLRSGNGYNHEHADRNSIIVKCFGEQLIVDPLRPPYWFRDPAWILRETAGHSAVLIGGKGQFHNNGVEGTNATRAQARLRDKGEGAGYSYSISDATQAYRIEDYHTRKVIRATVVLFDIPAVIVVDCVSRWITPAEVEARFFGDNFDGACEMAASDSGFTIKRPGAKADARVFSRDAIKVETALLPIPEERAVKNPFVAVKLKPTMATTLVSVVGLGRASDDSPHVSFESNESQIKVSIRHRGKAATCWIEDQPEVPGIKVQLG